MSAKKVLCIEDDAVVAKLYGDALRRAGYEVAFEVDGQKGLQLAQTDKYDFILLDLMLPTITGIDVLRDLRDPQITPSLHSKIIITTNLEQRPSVRADIERHADGYLIKAEITPKQLVEFLDNIPLLER